MSAPAPTRRRWSQLALVATLLAVALCAVWVAREVSIVVERKSLRRWLDREVGTVVTPQSFRRGVQNPEHYALPFWRRWLGDEPVVSIDRMDWPEGKLQQVQRAFPEAEVGTLAP